MRTRCLYVVLAGLPVVMLAGCFGDGVVHCADGRICPRDTVCDDAHVDHISQLTPQGLGCVDPRRVAACDGMADNQPCSAQGIADGACEGGVCFPIACGDGFVEGNEVCDDGNTVPLDGCSADCMSNETCGNGVVDFDVGEQCDDGNLRAHDGCSKTCKREAPTWANVMPSVPVARQGLTMTYDAARGRVIAFGGYGQDNYFRSETWEWAGTSWTQWQRGPSPTIGGSLAFDAAHHLVVLFARQTWLFDGIAWRLEAPPTTPQLDGAPLAYDGAHHVVVMVGSAPDHTLQTWVWDGTTWTLKPSTITPPGRYRHAIAYDARRARIVMYGGMSFANGTVRLNDTWEWDGSNWEQKATTGGPGLRSDHALAYDAIRGTTVLFGGSDSNNLVKNDTWLWDGSQWTQPSSPSPPSGRMGHAMAFDVASGTLVMSGGWDFNVSFYNDTWEWNGTKWSQAIVPSFLTPLGSALSYDVARAKVLLFGGFDTANNALSATWEWDGAAWQHITTSPSPPARADGAMVYDETRRTSVLFGGRIGTPDYTSLGDTWIYDGTSKRWTQAQPVDKPTPRIAPMAYDARRARGVLFGGYDSVTYYGDTWEWDGVDWVQRTTSAPQARITSLAYDPIAGDTLLFGGYITYPTNAQQDDTWQWDGSTWSRLAPGTSPPPSISALTYDAARETVVLFGGPAIQTWEWSSDDRWALAPVATAPSQGPMVYDRAREATVLAGTQSTWTFRFESTTPSETCKFGFDTDDDGRFGCADPDCWGYCTPFCSPGTSCDLSLPRCGDGVCQSIENCRMCPGDCGACTAICGDFLCDPGETAASCPGDCS